MTYIGNNYPSSVQLHYKDTWRRNSLGVELPVYSLAGNSLPNAARFQPRACTFTCTRAQCVSITGDYHRWRKLSWVIGIVIHVRWLFVEIDVNLCKVVVGNYTRAQQVFVGISVLYAVCLEDNIQLLHPISVNWTVQQKSNNSLYFWRCRQLLLGKHLDSPRICIFH